MLVDRGNAETNANHQLLMVKQTTGHAVLQGCKSQAWQIGPGRAGRARISAGPGRAVFCQYSAKISPIFHHFFERIMLNLKWVNNKVQIFFKKSFKNTARNKIGHDRPGPAQDFSWAGPLRPKIFAGRAVTARDFSWAGPDSPAQSGPTGPKIYNPGSYYQFLTPSREQALDSNVDRL